MKQTITKMLLMGFVWWLGMSCVVGQLTISNSTEIDSIINEISIPWEKEDSKKTVLKSSNKEILLHNIKFENYLRIEAKEIISPLLLDNITFLDNFNATDIRYKSDLFIRNTHFRGCKFAGFSFQKDIIFQNCTFKHLVFEYGKFGGTLAIENSNFEDDLRLFEGVLMPDSLHFYNNTFSKDMDFTKVPYSKSKCKIFLTMDNYTDLSKLIIPSDRFTLGFQEIRSNDTTDTFIEMPFEYKASAYEQIIKKCQSLGMTESVEGWIVEYKQVKNLHNYGEVLGGAWNWLQNTWWGFGYERQQIVYCAFFLFFLFSIINIFLLNSLLREVYYDSEISKNFFPKHINTADKLLGHLRANSWYRTLFNKFTYSLHYTGIIYFGLKVKHESLNTKTPWVLYFYFVYLVGIVHLAGIAAYILK